MQWRFFEFDNLSEKNIEIFEDNKYYEGFSENDQVLTSSANTDSSAMKNILQPKKRFSTSSVKNIEKKMLTGIYQ